MSKKLAKKSKSSKLSKFSKLVKIKICLKIILVTL